MTETLEIESNDLDEVYEFLVSAEVVEGPPEFRDIVATLWPELLHKVKPPVSEMHQKPCADGSLATHVGADLFDVSAILEPRDSEQWQRGSVEDATAWMNRLNASPLSKPMPKQPSPRVGEASNQAGTSRHARTHGRDLGSHRPDSHSERWLGRPHLALADNGVRQIVFANAGLEPSQQKTHPNPHADFCYPTIGNSA